MPRGRSPTPKMITEYKYNYDKNYMFHYWPKDDGVKKEESTTQIYLDKCSNNIPSLSP